MNYEENQQKVPMYGNAQEPREGASLGAGCAASSADICSKQLNPIVHPGHNQYGGPVTAKAILKVKIEGARSVALKLDSEAYYHEQQAAGARRAAADNRLIAEQLSASLNALHRAEPGVV